jgi:hypothetical protein
MRAELSFPHAVGAYIEQRRSRLPAGAVPVNAEAGEHDTACNQDRDDLGWRNIRIELEIEALP